MNEDPVRAANDPPDGGAAEGRSLIAVFGLFALVLASYWSTLDNGFLSDDFAYLQRARSVPILAQVRAEFSAANPDAAFMRPLAIPLFLADESAYGLWAGGYHVTNALLHLLNVVLLYFVLRRAFPACAFLAAGLFAAAPFSVEAVAWISARFDLLATTFYLLGILALMTDRPLLAALAGIAAMFSKEIGVTFPLVAVGISMLRKRGVGPALPAVLAGLLYLGLRWVAFGGIGGYRDPTGSTILLDPERWILAVVAWSKLPLVVMIPVDAWTAAVFPWVWAVGGLMALPWLALLRRKSWGLPVAVGFAWAVVTLLPVALFPTSSRHLYLPAIGLALALSSLVRTLRRKKAIGALLLLAYVLVANLNLMAWESASQYSKDLVRELRQRPLFDGQLAIVVPDHVGGAPLGRNAVPYLAPLFRPEAELLELSAAEFAALPAEKRDRTLAPRFRVCLPSLGSALVIRAADPTPGSVDRR